MSGFLEGNRETAKFTVSACCNIEDLGYNERMRLHLFRVKNVTLNYKMSRCPH